MCAGVTGYERTLGSVAVGDRVYRLTCVMFFRDSTVVWAAGAFVAALATGGCAGRSSVETRAAAPTGPVITRLEPPRGPIGQSYPIRLTVFGSGFEATGNVVEFGPVTVEDLPSNDGGRRITLSVPKVIPGTGEVPRFVLPPGEYSVTVTTADGTSAPVTFTLFRSQRAVRR